MVPHPPGRVIEDGDKARAAQRLRDLRGRQAREFRQGGEQVDTFCQLAGDGALLRDSGGDEEKGDAIGLLVVRVLGPDAVLFCKD